MAVSKRLRYEILRRDNHTCRYCGATAPDVKITIDHVTPETLGGPDTPGNLVAACHDCNAGKSASNPDAPLVANVAQDALRWAQAMKRAAQHAAEQHELLEQYRNHFHELWSRWGVGEGENRKLVPLPADWKSSLDRFNQAGLPAWMWDDIVTISMSNTKVRPEKKFTYCCGIAWKKITELQELAKKSLAVSARLHQDDQAEDSEDEDDEGSELPPEEAFMCAVEEVWHTAFKKSTGAGQEASVDFFLEPVLRAARQLIGAAQLVGDLGLESIVDQLPDEYRDRQEMDAASFQAWSGGWRSNTGTYPPNEHEAEFHLHLDALRVHGIDFISRTHAAYLAGCNQRADLVNFSNPAETLALMLSKGDPFDVNGTAEGSDS